jgi:SAM-dependent methyltransferase
VTITLLKGVPGSGKSRLLIELVNTSTMEGRPVQTFVCSDYPWPSDHEAFWDHRRLVCGEAGLTCEIDHFVSREEAAAILATTPPGSLAAIEEGYAFTQTAVADWRAASNRGVEIVVAAPSGNQIYLLDEHEYTEVTLSVPCQRCGSRDAEEAIIRSDGDGTLAVCAACFAVLADEARESIVQSLRDEHPFPGEEALYQPIGLPEVENWRLARWDTERRAAAMIDVLADLGLYPNGLGLSPTYLDIGCNTGFFCDYLAKLGFRSKGVDATERFIRSARLLDAFFRRQARESQEWALFELANAYEYLRDTQQERFDVTSSFATFQWVMIQRTPQHGLECIKWLAAKTKHVCFLELGYTREEMYRDQLGVDIDRDWVLRAMSEWGGFSDLRVIDASPGELQRDLFIGVKAAGDVGAP